MSALYILVSHEDCFGNEYDHFLGVFTSLQAADKAMQPELERSRKDQLKSIKRMSLKHGRERWEREYAQPYEMTQRRDGCYIWTLPGAGAMASGFWNYVIQPVETNMIVEEKK